MARLVSTALLDQVQLNPQYLLVGHAARGGMSAGQEILSATFGGMSRQNKSNDIFSSLLEDTDAVDTAHVASVGELYRRRQLITTMILDKMDALHWSNSSAAWLYIECSAEASGLRLIMYTNRVVGVVVAGLAANGATALVMLDRTVLTAVRDTMLIRGAVLLVSASREHRRHQSLPYPRQLEAVFRSMDGLLEHYGDAAYRIVKMVEPICVGTQLEIHDVLNTKGSFLDKIRREVRASALEAELSATAARPACAALESELLSLHHPHLRCEVYGLNKARGYCPVDPRKAFQKAKNLMTTRGELSAHANRVVREARGALIKRMCIEPLQKTGHIPPVESIPESSGMLKQWFRNQAVDLVMRGPQAPNLLDWSDIRFSNFLSFDLVPDWPALLLDKGISLPLDELAFMFNKDLTRLWKSTPEHSRRLLIEAWCKEDINIEALSERYWRDGFQPQEQLFAMTPKEKQLDVEVRMFTFSVLERRLWNSVLERNVKQEVLPLIPGQTMTLSGMAVTRKLMSPVHTTGAMKEARYWRPMISLDLKKWCQQFFAGNTYEAFGIQPTYSQIQAEYGKCIFYRCQREHPPGLLKLSEEERRMDERFKQSRLTAKCRELRERALAREDLDGVFRSEDRGGEGILHKYWTVITSAIIDTVADVTRIKTEVMSRRQYASAFPTRYHRVTSTPPMLSPCWRPRAADTCPP